jgi:hypothetical protein
MSGLWVEFKLLKELTRNFSSVRYTNNNNVFFLTKVILVKQKPFTYTGTHTREFGQPTQD